MKYGAYNRKHKSDIVWFRTNRPMSAGYYHRHTRRKEPPDVCIADSVPALIMKAYSWIHEGETEFQQEVGSTGLDAEEKNQISDKLTDQLVQRLDPNDDKVWVDEPHWVKHLIPNNA